MLRYHPDVSMPVDRKELHFFDSGLWKGADWYAWNWRHANSLIRGDITPAYSVLDIEGIEEIKEIIGFPVVTFVLRDPVERAWSMAYMDLVKNPLKDIEKVDDSAFYSHFISKKSLSRGGVF